MCPGRPVEHENRRTTRKISGLLSRPRAASAGPATCWCPRWDPSVLFTPAGMNQFKDHFLGKVQARVHPGHDLPEVPAHRRHRQRRPHRLPPHVFRDAGQLQLRRLLQARGDQLGLGVSHRQEVAGPRSARPAHRHRLSRRRRGGRHLGSRHQAAAGPHRADGRGRQLLAGQRARAKGPDGVCGPCSEIYFHPGTASDVEIWNLVFTQFNRVGDAARTTCARCPARTSTPAWAWSGPPPVLQGVPTNYHIDILRPIVLAAAEVCGVKYDPAKRQRPPAAAHHRPRPGLHVRRPRKRLSRPEQGEVRRQAAAAAGRARRPPDGPPRAVPVSSSCRSWPR